MRLLGLSLTVVLMWGAPARGADGSTVAPPPPPSAAELRIKAEELLERWVKAHNQRDWKAWEALYEPHHFMAFHGWLGFPFDFASWRETETDSRVVDSKTTIEQVTVESWVEPDTGLREGRVRVSFVERWGRFDHCDDEFELSWNPQRRALLIAVESKQLVLEHEQASPPAVTVTLGRVTTLDEAWAAWRRLPLRGDNVAAVLDGVTAQTRAAPATARLLALAVLAHVNWSCPMVYDDPDNDYHSSQSRKAPDDAAGIDDSCVGWRMALWALAQRALLREADLPVIEKTLVAMLAHDEPDDPELEQSAAYLARRFREETRYRLMSKAGGTAEAILRLTLTPPLLARAAVERHDGLAALMLDAEVERAAVLHAIADAEIDEWGRAELIREHLGDVRGSDVDQALVAATNGTGCELMMAGADARARRGDASLLPQRSDDEERNRTALCRLVFDPDPQRKLKIWRSFLPPRGSALLVRRKGRCSTSERPLTRANASLKDLERSLADRGPDARTTVEFKVRQGKLYVSALSYEAEHPCY